MQTTTNLVLSRNETDSMRGIAIIFIILHNLLHLLLPTIENEFTFCITRSEIFARRAFEPDLNLWQDIFSFLGWYGVAVFLFLSGYGLTRKYGFSTESSFEPKIFVWNHIKRIFLLMILPYIPFAIIQIQNSASLMVPLQVTFLSNIFAPNDIYPGVFWFFGLIVQFYILFAFIRNTRNIRHRSYILLFLNALSIICMLCVPEDSSTLNHIRYNFIGWMLPFTAGIWFAQRDYLNKFFDSFWKNAMWVLVCGFLVVISNFNYYAWIASPAFAIFASIGLTKISTRYSIIDKSCIWLGTLSAFIFAVHPFVRLLCTKYLESYMTRPHYILGYVVVSIVVAFICSKFYRHFLSH